MAVLAALAVLMGAFAYARIHRHGVLPPVGTLARIERLRQLSSSEPTAANYRLLAEARLAAKDLDGARDAYEEAAAVYRQKGMISEAYAQGRLAQRYETQVVPYVHLPNSSNPAEPLLAKLEPQTGCYTGAFIDHEDSIRGTYRDEYGTWRRDASAFNHLTGVHHAIFFMYLGYGRQFPTKFVRHMNDNGAAAQIAWEPTSLDQVQDDAYLHDFARAARESRTPIFLRFASEMNGDWVPYNGDPTRYIEKFRLVASVMHREAPNVAMVWCPFEIPVRTLSSYYPGPEAVDWVGLNVYAVPFWDNDPRRPADWRNPSDSLRYVYGLYAAKHPIMICEFAASHRSNLDELDRAEFARTKMSQFYSALPRLYPRVKAVCWLSMNAIKHAIPGRQSNDYSILGDPAVNQRYGELLSDSYFLPAVSRHAPANAKQKIVPLTEGMTLKGLTPLSAWVKMPDDHPTVVWKVNGAEKLRSDLTGPYRWVLDTCQVPAGPATIELLVSDEMGTEVAHLTRHVKIEH